jgi:pyruvate,orthophosphate dikinase
MNQFSDAWGTTVMYRQWCMVIWGLTLVLVWHLAETRNWRKYFNGEYLINAQGEDVVSGVRTPQQITLIGSESGRGDWCF